jgi:hypothetical protein
MANTENYWSSVLLKPKRQYKWFMEFSGMGEQIQKYMVKSVSKPSITIGEASHTFINHTFYFPGRLSWSAIDVTLVDPISPNASVILMNAIKASGYALPGTIPPGGDSVASSAGVSFSKAKAVGQLGQVRLVQIDDNMSGHNSEVEDWTLKNAWIKDVQFGSWNYDTDDLSTIQLTLRYDWAELNQHMLTVT